MSDEDLSSLTSPVLPPDSSSIQTSTSRRRAKRLYLINQIRDEINSLSPIRKIIQLALLLALLSFFAFLYNGFENNAFTTVLFYKPQEDFGVVLDAGSHGTRLHLYKWPARTHDPDHPLFGPVTFPTAIWTITTSPGISDVADMDSAGKLCIKPLLLQLINKLESIGVYRDRWTSIPIFLKATAGYDK